MQSHESIVARSVRLAFSLAAVMSVAACATAGSSATTPSRAASMLASPTPSTTRSSYVIAGASLPSERQLLDVVRARWPQLLSGELPRGNAGQTASIDRFGVYDAKGTFLGGPEVLLNVRAREVQELRRLTAMEEYARLGRRHPAGAVLVTWSTGV